MGYGMVAGHAAMLWECNKQNRSLINWNERDSARCPAPRVGFAHQGAIFRVLEMEEEEIDDISPQAGA